MLFLYLGQKLIHARFFGTGYIQTVTCGGVRSRGDSNEFDCTVASLAPGETFFGFTAEGVIAQDSDNQGRAHVRKRGRRPLGEERTIIEVGDLDFGFRSFGLCIRGEQLCGNRDGRKPHDGMQRPCASAQL